MNDDVLSFLFTDVEGSTRMWEQRPRYMRQALAEHDVILREAIAAEHGTVFSTAGDAFAAAFASPARAIAAAAAAQLALHRHEWPDGRPLRVRMGVHCGPAQQRDDNFFGPTLNRTARLASAAHGGQTLLTDAARRLLGDPALIDLGEHRLKDLSEPEHVWQLPIEGLGREFGSLRTLDTMPTNLPVALSSFIGRADDIADLMALLATNRLVTMTGVGGVGKTRLSLQVAADVSHHYPQGVWFVALAPVRVGDAVPFRFLEMLGLESRPGQRPLETVAESIGDGDVLLVVDNCEHVLEPAAGAIVELLGACPNLRVLASSQRPLNVRGERVRPIRPLSVGGADDSSLELFIDRAIAAGAGADVSERVEVITEICRRLDGVPLAIELAAARCRAMTPDDVAARLDERFRLLRSSPSTDRDERHRTLQSTIEWSYDLLDSDQQLLLQRLAVFAGSFTPDAVEQVCADERLDDLAVFDLLHDLVDHSLLVADTTGASVHYSMLETIRQFAAERLGVDLPALRDRHARYHAERAERLGAALWTADELAAVDELEAGWSDVRAAAVHSTGDLDQLARMLGPLVGDAYFRARLELGDWAEAALAVADTDGASDAALVVFLGCAATVRGVAGDADAATVVGRRLAEHCERTAAPLPAAIGPPVIAGLNAVDSELAWRLLDITERGVTDASARWERASLATARAVLATFSGMSDMAAEATALAADLAPADFSPSMRALVEWMTAVNGDAPMTERVRRLEGAIELSTSVRANFLTSFLVLHLGMMRATLGDDVKSMLELADNLDAMAANHSLGVLSMALQNAAALLIKHGEHDRAAAVLGWVDDRESNVPPDFAAFMARRVAQMHAALGDDATRAAASTGAALSADDVIRFASSSLRTAATDLEAS